MHKLLKIRDGILISSGEGGWRGEEVDRRKGVSQRFIKTAEPAIDKTFR